MLLTLVLSTTIHDVYMYTVESNKINQMKVADEKKVLLKLEKRKGMFINF